MVQDTVPVKGSARGLPALGYVAFGDEPEDMMSANVPWGLHEPQKGLWFRKPLVGIRVVRGNDPNSGAPFGLPRFVQGLHDTCLLVAAALSQLHTTRMSRLWDKAFETLVFRGSTYGSQQPWILPTWRCEIPGAGPRGK